jgi:Tfp pilus assembly protein PilO
MKKNLSIREKVLLVAAVTAVAIAPYISLRIKPQLAQRAALEKRVATLEKQLAKAEPPKSPPNAAETRKHLEEARTRLEQVRAELQRFEQDRVDASSELSLAGLMQAIVSHAEASGLVVEASGVHNGAFESFGIVTKDELAKLGKAGAGFRFRPLRNLTVTGPYGRIQSFIKSVSELDREVNVLKFSIKSAADKTQGQAFAAPVLVRAELVLAL